MWGKDEIEALAKRLGHYHGVLLLHLQARMVASSERSTAQAHSMESTLKAVLQTITQQLNRSTTQAYSMESTFKAELQTITQQLNRFMPPTEAKQHVSGHTGPGNGTQPPRPDVVNKSLLTHETGCCGGHVQTNVTTPAYGARTPIPPSPNPVPANREESDILTKIQETKQLTQHIEEHLEEHPAEVNAALAQRNTGESPTIASTLQPLEDHENQEGHTSLGNSCDLMTVLENLKGLISEEGLFLFLEDARSILETLDKVFELFEEATVSLPVVPEHRRRKRSESPEAADALPRPHIKRARGVIANSHSVSVGHRGKSYIRFD